MVIAVKASWLGRAQPLKIGFAFSFLAPSWSKARMVTRQEILGGRGPDPLYVLFFQLHIENWLCFVISISETGGPGAAAENWLCFFICKVVIRNFSAMGLGRHRCLLAWRKFIGSENWHTGTLRSEASKTIIDWRTGLEGWFSRYRPESAHSKCLWMR
jgi:hypothetical protein